MHFQWDFQGPPNNGTPFMVSGTHTIPISLGIRTWEWYGNATEVYQGQKHIHDFLSELFI